MPVRPVKQRGRRRSTISRRLAPEFCIDRSLVSKREGAGNTGYRLIPAVRVQQKARGRTTGQPNNRPSLRNGLDGLYALSSGTALFAPVVLRIICRNTWHQHRDARTTRFRRRIDLFVHVKITLQTDAPTASEAQRS